VDSTGIAIRALVFNTGGLNPSEGIDADRWTLRNHSPGARDPGLRSTRDLQSYALSVVSVRNTRVMLATNIAAQHFFSMDGGNVGAM